MEYGIIHLDVAAVCRHHPFTGAGYEASYYPASRHYRYMYAPFGDSFGCNVPLCILIRGAGAFRVLLLEENVILCSGIYQQLINRHKSVPLIL